MKLAHIDLGNIDESAINMRASRKAPDVADLLPTVRRRGIIVPVVVRPGTGERFELVAGRRRIQAARLALAEEGADPELARIPAAIMEAGDDAAALEASLIENLARLDPDEVTQWETFTRLVREGRSLADLSATFGLPDIALRRILALGNLMPRIRSLYQREDIDRTTVHHLTMASKSQQRAWLALLDDPEAHAPRGHQLKAWLFNGQSIPVRHALFDIEGMTGIVADLFGEDRYFADPDAFWALQNAAIDARRIAYLAAGWADAVVVPPSSYFHSWEHEKAAKRKGGRVYIDVRASGEVTFHEGYVTAREAQRIARGEAAPAGQKPARPEITGTMQTYIDLHRHAALRAGLTDHPGVALRLMVAHAIAGSPLWGVRVEPQATRHDAIRESVATCRGEVDFVGKRREALALLGYGPDDTTLAGAGYGCLDGILLRLLPLADAQVMAILCIVMGETLAAGSGAVEIAGDAIGLDMASWWQADDAFFEALRDREVLTAIVAEVAGETVASANAGEKATVLKTIIRDRLDGTNGRAKRERWLPKWLAFPPAAYTARGGVGTVERAERIVAAQAETEGQALDPGDDEGPVGAEFGADRHHVTDGDMGGVTLAA